MVETIIKLTMLRALCMDAAVPFSAIGIARDDNARKMGSINFMTRLTERSIV